MITIYDKKRNIGYFDSIDEYINYLETAAPYDNTRDCASITGTKSFTGTQTLTEALNLCKYGDKDLSDYVYKKSLTIDNVDTLNKIKRSYTNDVVGFTPNVPLFVMGVPTNMIKDNRQVVNSKIINMYINLSASCGVSAQKIKDNASMYVAAINQLEKEGYRCNVYCGNTASYSNSDTCYLNIIKIKSDREPLNLVKMAFPLCHPSMLRRLSFKWIESIPIDFTHAGYGRPIDNDDRVMELIKPILGDIKLTVLSISENNGHVDNVINILKKKGMVNDEKAC